MAPVVLPHKTLINLNYFPIAILFSLLLCKSVASDGLITTCPPANQTHNQTTQDTYRINLKNLLSNFTTSASTLSYHSSTAGKSPDEVYGLYLCRGDATSKLCHSCVTNLTNWISDEIDSACTEGFGYMDSCMLHYANYSFFGKFDNQVLGYSVTWVNVTNVGEFNRTLTGMVGELISDAAFKSVGLFATREASVGGRAGKVYGLAQCTPDIGRVNCSACLKRASQILEGCCGDKTSAWFWLSSCQLRYDNSSFYEVFGASPPANSNVDQAVSGVFLLASWAFLLFNLF